MPHSSIYILYVVCLGLCFSLYLDLHSIIRTQSVIHLQASEHSYFNANEVAQCERKCVICSLMDISYA